MPRRDRFREVYEHFATLIDTGKMKPGERLPTILEIADLWKTSYATATKAVGALSRDLYVTTNRTGTYVFLSGPDRVYQQLCDVLNQLEVLEQDPHLLVSEGGIPVVRGLDGDVCWNPEAERWEKLAA